MLLVRKPARVTIPNVNYILGHLINTTAPPRSINLMGFPCVDQSMGLQGKQRLYGVGMMSSSGEHTGFVYVKDSNYSTPPMPSPEHCGETYLLESNVKTRKGQSGSPYFLAASRSEGDGSDLGPLSGMQPALLMPDGSKIIVGVHVMTSEPLGISYGTAITSYTYGFIQNTCTECQMACPPLVELSDGQFLLLF